MVNANTCILNGRNYAKNDFISVSVKGSSAVDYCLISHENLPLFGSFNVIRTVGLISRLRNINSVAPVSFPDHSVIVWQLSLDAFIDTTVDAENIQSSADVYDKFDVSSVLRSFYPVMTLENKMDVF